MVEVYVLAQKVFDELTVDSLDNLQEPVIRFLDAGP